MTWTYWFFTPCRQHRLHSRRDVDCQHYTVSSLQQVDGSLDHITLPHHVDWRIVQVIISLCRQSHASCPPKVLGEQAAFGSRLQDTGVGGRGISGKGSTQLSLFCGQQTAFLKADTNWTHNIDQLHTYKVHNRAVLVVHGTTRKLFHSSQFNYFHSEILYPLNKHENLRVWRCRN